MKHHINSKSYDCNWTDRANNQDMSQRMNWISKNRCRSYRTAVIFPEIVLVAPFICRSRGVCGGAAHTATERYQPCTAAATHTRTGEVGSGSLVERPGAATSSARSLGSSMAGSDDTAARSRRLEHSTTGSTASAAGTNRRYTLL